MKVQEFQASEEKTILMALITHTGILGRIAKEAGTSPFKSKWSNLVAGWCFSFYAKHKKAPGKIIQDLFTIYAQKNPGEESVRLVESFLESLSGEYQKIAAQLNEDWVLEKAADYFDLVRLEKMTSQMEIALESRDLSTARELRAAFRPVSFSKDAYMNPFSREEIQKTLAQIEKNKPLIEFQGDMGRFLSEHFERDAFIAFAGPEKRGKSFWLQEMVWTALNQRRRVLYIVLGDMSEEQVKRRLYARMTLKPRKPLKHSLRWPTAIKVGVKDADGRPVGEVSSREVFPEPYSEAEIIQAIKVLRINSAMKQLPLRIMCKDGGEISATDINHSIERLIVEEGFLPDVVVVDYMDLLAQEAGTSKLDIRHQIDASWKTARKISTKYHLLFIGATQAAARGYDKWLLSKKDFSEDKRKNAHVTGMIGLNQSAAEKVKGLYRLNWINLRDGEWSESQYCWTAGNLALGCPCLRSLLGESR